MKIVRILGGLGNQMFQYAFLVALRERLQEEVLMDTNIFDSYKLHNGFELDRIFNITAEKANVKQIRELTRYTNNYFLARIYRRLPQLKTECREKFSYKYYPEFLQREGDAYYDGYWQYYKYFDCYKKALLDEFSFKSGMDEYNTAFLNHLQNSTFISVSLHVRRGDYLNHKLYKGICNMNYYHKAISYVNEILGDNIHFVIFSNDPTWCDSELRPLLKNSQEVTIVDWNKGVESYKDLRLMASCQVNIIANSSFSWWAAYLNQHFEKKVIAPVKWINLPLEYPIQLPSWKLL